MTHDIDAIYDQGVFRPLEPLMMPDGTRVHLRVEEEKRDGGVSSSQSTEGLAQDRKELDEFRRVMSELPLESPLDGFSGADHDQLLYGKP
jgi:predicted DNA-binding antitoxin AbrB/MazE fold protein